MENTEMGTPVFPKKEKAEKKANTGLVAVVLSVMAVLISLGGAGLSLLNYFAIGYLSTDYIDRPYFDGNNTSLESSTVEGVAEKVSPSVVSITTETRTRGFFGGTSTSEAAGTGIIVTSDGYILTNKHVIDGATTVRVIRDDGETFEDVRVVGTDPVNDVAFIKVDGAKDWPAAELGDSKTLKIGQPVMAIGNALGQFQNTITQGVVSGLGRSITAGDGAGNYENLTDMIQTDASINPGNSGGPLVNAGGQVIGINTAVSTDANGIGFAIPISTVRGMLTRLVETGKVERAYIGVYFLTITPDVAEEYGLPVREGAYVHNDKGNGVMSGTPAEKAGMKDGDIVISVGGVKVGKLGTLTSLVSEFPVGATIEIVVLRGGNEIPLRLTLEAYPKN